MADTSSIVEPSDYKAVILRVRRLWNEGTTVFTTHAQDAMEERGVHELDIQHVIRFGKITGHSKPGEFWRYRMEGETVDGDWLGVIVEINGSLIIVTVLTKR